MESGNAIGAEYSYEYGYNMGKKFHPVYKSIIKLLSHMYKFKSPFKMRYKDQTYILKDKSPILYEELTGLSNSLKIKLEKILQAQILISNFGNECTVTASTKKATKNNDTFLTENWDDSIFNPIFFLNRHLFTKNIRVHNIGNNYKYLFVGIPVLYEIPLLNEKGLGYSGNGTIITKENSMDFDEGSGTTIYELIRQTMMKCKNTSEVKNLWGRTKRSAYKNRIYPHHWDFGSSTWCDKNGDLLSIEQTHKKIIFVDDSSITLTKAPENIIWHANHHQWLGSYNSGSVNSSNLDSISSGLREIRAKKLLLDNYGNITLDVCKSITRDHKYGFNGMEKNSGTICRHPDKNLLKATIFSYILEPKKMTVHLTHGYPCRLEYEEINCEKLFF
jgi:hypothetical protein